jgi:hypothetical protein
MAEASDTVTQMTRNPPHFQVTRLREFQGVDERFDEIAQEYRELTLVSFQLLAPRTRSIKSPA